MGLLQKKREDLEKIVIINQEKNNSNQVSINDSVKVKLMMGEEIDEFSFNLVASLSPKEDEISINSPMGRAVYQRKVGDRVSYRVNERNLW